MVKKGKKNKQNKGMKVQLSAAELNKRSKRAGRFNEHLSLDDDDESGMYHSYHSKTAAGQGRKKKRHKMLCSHGALSVDTHARHYPHTSPSQPLSSPGGAMFAKMRERAYGGYRGLQHKVVGTCQKLEKPYLRLTAVRLEGGGVARVARAVALTPLGPQPKTCAASPGGISRKSLEPPLTDPCSLPK